MGGQLLESGVDIPAMEAILQMQAYPKHFEKHAAQCFEEEKQNQKILQEVPKRQSTAEPSTAVALCTAMSYILSRGIVHLDTNDTKIKDER